MVGVRGGQAMEAAKLPLKVAWDPAPTTTSPAPPMAPLFTMAGSRDGRGGGRGRNARGGELTFMTVACAMLTEINPALEFKEEASPLLSCGV